MRNTMSQPEQPKRRRGRPTKDPNSVVSGAERQKAYRTRQQMAMGQALALIAAMDRMVTNEQRDRLEEVPAFADLLGTARLRSMNEEDPHTI